MTINHRFQERAAGFGVTIFAVAFIGACGCALAQTEAPAKHDCTVKSDAESEKNLSEKLDDCNGVLKPPIVGDGKIVSPSNSTGTMPIIKPGELPKNQNP
ncbi:hypothetical protein [Pararhizobium sp. PWRC1-1]|uniref:hypothetical protein n=1 Tax=Pararhizobium sp. PWRC1-1 TaxID=2804566 RepID=UPI003CF1D951